MQGHYSNFLHPVIRYFTGRRFDGSVDDNFFGVDPKRARGSEPVVEWKGEHSAAFAIATHHVMESVLIDFAHIEAHIEPMVRFFNGLLTTRPELLPKELRSPIFDVKVDRRGRTSLHAQPWIGESLNFPPEELVKAHLKLEDEAPGPDSWTDNSSPWSFENINDDVGGGEPGDDPAFGSDYGSAAHEDGLDPEMRKEFQRVLSESQGAISGADGVLGSIPSFEALLEGSMARNTVPKIKGRNARRMREEEEDGEEESDEEEEDSNGTGLKEFGAGDEEDEDGGEMRREDLMKLMIKASSLLESLGSLESQLDGIKKKDPALAAAAAGSPSSSTGKKRRRAGKAKKDAADKEEEEEEGEQDQGELKKENKKKSKASKGTKTK